MNSCRRVSGFKMKAKFQVCAYCRVICEERGEGGLV